MRKSLLRKLSVLSVVLSISTAATLLAGCTASASVASSHVASARKEKSITIGVSMSNNVSIDFAWVKYMKAVPHPGFKITWVVSMADGNAVLQNQQIQDMINRHVNVIIARAHDETLIDAAVLAARTAKIPFVALDRLPAVKPTVFAGMSSYNVAYATSLAFAKLLESKHIHGNCINLEGALTDPNAIAFNKAWLAVGAKTHAYTTLETIPTNWLASLFRSGVVSGFTAHPTANCLYAASDFVFGSVISALKQLHRYIPVGKRGHIYIAASGTFPPAIPAIKGGYIDDDGEWDIKGESTEAVTASLQILRGKKFPLGKTFTMPTYVVTPQNIATVPDLWDR